MPRTERMRDMPAEGHTPTEARDGLGVSCPTIRKCARMDGLSPEKPAPIGTRSKPDPHKGHVEEMLGEDGRCCRRRRRTAKRAFEGLRGEHGFGGSYPTVQRHLRGARPGGPRDQSVRLGRGPGTTEVGFGRADLDHPSGGGGRVRMRHLPMSFPYPSHEACEAFGDEGDACVCRGLKDRFGRMGGAPPVAAPDDAAGAGGRCHDAIVGSGLFRRLRMRCGFPARFCDPSAGEGRGSVEGRAGHTRGDFFVPAPRVGDLGEHSRAPAEATDAHPRERAHCEEGLAWAEPLEADGAHPLPLPERPFGVARWMPCAADGCGRATPDGRRRHLASPEPANAAPVVGVRAFTAEVDAPDGAPLGACPRRTGRGPTAGEGPLALLGLLPVRARAFRGGSACRLSDGEARARLDGMRADEPRGQAEAMSRPSAAYGMGAVAEACSGALGGGGRDAAGRRGDALRAHRRRRRWRGAGPRARHGALGM